MDETSIKSDIPKQVEELTTDEFQQKLYSWFKDNGLLSDLKSYLRYQMISKLRGTNLGQSISDFKPNALSPKIQAINLLIAEYLHQRHHHYTLSIFSSEVPLPLNLNSLPFYVRDNLNSNKDIQILKMKDICDILDTIGFGQNTVEGEYIIKDHQSNPQDGLLICIIRCLSKSRQMDCIDNIEDLQEPNIDINMFRWLTNIHNMLIKSKVKGAQLKFLKKHINNLFKSELDRIKVEESSKYKTLIEEKENFIQTELARKEIFFKNKLKQYEKKIKHYKQSLQKDLQGKQNHLENLAKQLQEQHARVTENIFEVQSRFKEVEFREHQIKQLYEENTHKISDLQKDLDYRKIMLDEREKVISNLQHILENNHDAVKSAINEQIHEVDILKTQCFQLKEELEQTKSTVHSHIEVETQNKTVKSRNEIDIAELKDMYSNVQSENISLKAEVQNLTSCLDKLNRDLQARTTTPDNFFNQRNDTLSHTVELAASTDSQLPTRRRGPRLTRQLGGGEEAILPNERSTHVPRFRSFDLRDVRRRPVRKSSDSTSSSDSSPTEEIVKDARDRLRKLKKESDAVERHYRKYRARSPVKLANDIRHAREEMLKNIETTNLYIPVFGRQNFGDVVKRMREGRKEYYDMKRNHVDLSSFYTQSEMTPRSDTFTMDLNKKLETNGILENNDYENSNVDLKKKKVSFSNILNVEVDNVYEMENEQCINENSIEKVNIVKEYVPSKSSPVKQGIFTDNESNEELKVLKLSFDEFHNQNEQYSTEVNNSVENTNNINTEHSKCKNKNETSSLIVTKSVIPRLNQCNEVSDNDNKESSISLNTNVDDQNFTEKNGKNQLEKNSDSNSSPKSKQTNTKDLKEDIVKSTGAIKKKYTQESSPIESPVKLNTFNKNNIIESTESSEDIPINILGLPVIRFLDYNLNNLILDEHVPNKQKNYNSNDLELSDQIFQASPRDSYSNKREKINSHEKCDAFLEETNSDSKFTTMKIICTKSISIEDIASQSEPVQITEISQQFKSNTMQDSTNAVLSEMSCPETLSKLSLVPNNQNIPLLDKRNSGIESVENNQFGKHCTNLSQFQEVLSEIKKTIDDNEENLVEKATESIVNADSSNISFSSAESLSDQMSIGFDPNIEDAFWN